MPTADTGGDVSRCSGRGVTPAERGAFLSRGSDSNTGTKALDFTTRRYRGSVTIDPGTACAVMRCDPQPRGPHNDRQRRI